MAWLITLFGLALLYARGDLAGIVRGVPFVGIAAGWSGSLGGVAISLKGVYDHWVDPSGQPEGKNEWNNNLLLWHVGRPASGVIVGVAVVILTKAAYPSGAPSSTVLSAAAFVLGMQEKRFFAWVKQIGAAIVSIPAKKSAGPEGNPAQTENKVE